jgi:hypothetical protein
LHECSLKSLFPLRMNNPLSKLSTGALQTLLSRETRKFIVAIEYGSTASDLSDIRETIKDLQRELDSRASNKAVRRDQTDWEKL